MDEIIKIVKDINEKRIKPIYFLMGEEPYYIDKLSDYIEQNVLTEEEKGFNQTVLYGRDVEVEDAEYYDGGDGLRDQASPERLMLSEEIKRAVFDTIDTLPEDLKTAITLRELEGMSYEDIANVMDCPVGTVRSRIFRAREAIDKRVQPLLQG